MHRYAYILATDSRH